MQFCHGRVASDCFRRFNCSSPHVGYTAPAVFFGAPHSVRCIYIYIGYIASYIVDREGVINCRLRQRGPRAARRGRVAARNVLKLHVAALGVWASVGEGVKTGYETHVEFEVC